MLDMRLSPSGPVLGEIPGEPFAGLQLRLAEVSQPLEGLTVPTADYAYLEVNGGAEIGTFLSNPSPDRRYGVRCHFGVQTNSATTATLNARLMASYDGVSWWQLAGNSVTTNAGNESVTMTVDFPMTLGSALPTPVPPDAVDAPNLRLRVAVISSASSVHSIPQPTGFGNRCLISLAEYA